MCRVVSRRELLKRLGLTGVAVLALPGLSRVLSFRAQLFAQAPVLGPVESATLAAVCARIIPTDGNGPGAAEARASTYIDRALGGWLAASRADYTAGLAEIDAAARSPIFRQANRTRCSRPSKTRRSSRSSAATPSRERSAIRFTAETRASSDGTCSATPAFD